MDLTFLDEYNYSPGNDVLTVLLIVAGILLLLLAIKFVFSYRNSVVLMLIAIILIPVALYLNDSRIKNNKENMYKAQREKLFEEIKKNTGYAITERETLNNIIGYYNSNLDGFNKQSYATDKHGDKVFIRYKMEFEDLEIFEVTETSEIKMY